MKIYADILFAINFSMDFISFFVTFALMRRKMNKKRILIASVIGGLYGVFDVLINLRTTISVITSLLISLIMCIVAYYEKSIKRFVSMYLIHWGVNACLGGFMSLLYSFMNSILAEYISNYSYNEVYTGARFFIIAALAIIVSIIFGRLFVTEKGIKEVHIKIIFNGRKYEMQGICDTGNLLKEPISGKAVILVSSESELGQIIEETPEIFKRFIPYRGVGTEGIIKGIIAEKLEINGIERVGILAPISKTDFAGYNACVPSVLVD